MSAQFAGEKSILLDAVLAMAILALIWRVHFALYVIRLPKQLKYSTFYSCFWFSTFCTGDGCHQRGGGVRKQEYTGQHMYTGVWLWEHSHGSVERYMRPEFRPIPFRIVPTFQQESQHQHKVRRRKGAPVYWKLISLPRPPALPARPSVRPWVSIPLIGSWQVQHWSSLPLAVSTSSRANWLLKPCSLTSLPLQHPHHPAII